MNKKLISLFFLIILIPQTSNPYNDSHAAIAAGFCALAGALYVIGWVVKKEADGALVLTYSPNKTVKIGAWIGVYLGNGAAIGSGLGILAAGGSALGALANHHYYPLALYLGSLTLGKGLIETTRFIAHKSLINKYWDAKSHILNKCEIEQESLEQFSQFKKKADYAFAAYTLVYILNCLAEESKYAQN